MTFANRVEAGRQLAATLLRYRGQDPVVLALPRGGVPVAGEIAAALNAPLDLIIARKVGVPQQPELAMGAVVDGLNPVTIRNEDVISLIGISDDAFARVRDKELAEIRRRRACYVGDRPHAAVTGKTAIVVDDGIATGATMKVALRAVRSEKPRKLVLAVPVAPTSALYELGAEADDVVCLDDRESFGAISWFYDDFSEVSDDEVVGILARFPAVSGGAANEA
jgi:putative phosphoribosyl transferase